MRLHIREFTVFVKLTVYTLLLAIGAGWIGDSLASMIPVSAPQADVMPSIPLVPLLLGFLAFISGAAGLYCARGTFLPVRVLSKNPRFPKKKVLILMVSSPNFSFHDEFSTISRNQNTIRLSHILQQDIEPSDMAWNWQQILRAISPHLPGLETIWLLGSSGNRGSFAHLRVCGEFLKTYPEIQTCTIRLYPDALDFENIDALREAFDNILTEEKQRWNREESDIVIDATGGPKTASIAAALFTTHHPELTFQYITNAGIPLHINVTACQPGDIG